MNFKTEFFLQLSFKQIPVFRNKANDIASIDPDFQLRKKIKLDYINYVGFESFIRKVIFDNIPTIYLEGYNNLISSVRLLNWPQKPKVIFTSAAYNSDDVFKAWAAKCVEGGSPLVIGQTRR